MQKIKKTQKAHKNKDWKKKLKINKDFKHKKMQNLMTFRVHSAYKPYNFLYGFNAFKFPVLFDNALS